VSAHRRPRSSGRAVRLRRLQAGITLWCYPDGREFLKVEARNGYGRKSGEKLRSEHFPWLYAGGYEEALEAARADVARAELASRMDKAAATAAAAPPAEEGDTAQPSGGWTLRKLIRKKYRPWATNGGLGAGTWPGYLRMIETWILPLLGDELLEEITAELVDGIKLKMLTKQCPVCAAKQERENYEHRRRASSERRRRKHRFNCKDDPACGYGLSTAQVNTFVLVLSAILTFARKAKLLRVHPLQADPDFKYQRPGRSRRIPVRVPHLIEPVCGLLRASHALAVRLELYMLLRPQEALALMFKDALDENGDPKPHLTVSKRIVPDATPGLHLVEGILVPHYVKEGLKTERVGRILEPWQFTRYPQLWKTLGEEIRALWVGEGRPPLTTFIVRQLRGPNKGWPPPDPASWASDNIARAAAAANVTYNANDSNASYRHIGACMLAVGPGWQTSEIAAFMGNDPATCARLYHHFYGEEVAPQYRGKSMDEIIMLARTLSLQQARLLPLRRAQRTRQGRPNLRLIEGGTP
jgi:hypothetical protein